MHGNGPADAPRISNTPRMGREWAVGAFLGRPAAACARNRAPAANAEVASAAYGWSGPQRHETLSGCAEASDSTTSRRVLLLRNSWVLNFTYEGEFKKGVIK